MNKLILKTALKTAACIIALVLVAFTVASLGFPAEMAGMCERAGNYSFATGYASLKYSYTKDVNDLSRCVVDSILAGNEANVIKFGEKLLADEGFAELAENADYKQYVCGNVACAQYASGKKDRAMQTVREAMLGVTDFPLNNSYAVLCIRVCEKADTVSAAELKDGLTRYAPEGERQQKYYDAITKSLESIISKEANQ